MASTIAQATAGMPTPEWAKYTWRIDGEGEMQTEELRRPVSLPAAKEIRIPIFEALGKHLHGEDLHNLAMSHGLISYAAVYGSKSNLPRILQVIALHDPESLPIGEEGILKMTDQAIAVLKDRGIKGKKPLNKWRGHNPPRVRLPGSIWNHCREYWKQSGKVVFARGKEGGRGKSAQSAACEYHYAMRYVIGSKGKAKAANAAQIASAQNELSEQEEGEGIARRRRRRRAGERGRGRGGSWQG